MGVDLAQSGEQREPAALSAGGDTAAKCSADSQATSVGRGMSACAPSLPSASATSFLALRKFAANEGVDEYNTNRFVFSHRVDRDSPWLPNWVTKAFIRCRREAGLSHFRLHDLRHFMVTEMLQAGIPIVVVSARLAHARASTTLNVYAHAMPGGDRDAAEMLADRIRL
jgi:integrase